jgi:copper chaperone NosL
MMKVGLWVLIAVFLFSCSVEPEPLRYGRDACHHCKMTLMDKKFGGELVTEKGKVYKFDDVNCMMTFLDSDQVAGEAFAFKLIIDYLQPEKFIPAEEAFYLKSDEIRSPMASEVAAFATEKSMMEYKSKLNAIYLSWGELRAQFK